MKTSSKRPILKVAPNTGGRTLVYYDSVLKAIGIDPATESPDRPLTITKARVVELTDYSMRTVDRMIADGRREAVAA
jgi:hypothetical protein